MTIADYKVLGCDDLIQVPSQKAEGGMLLKKQIRLQEFGGDSRNDTPERFGNAILATLFGDAAQRDYAPNSLVKVALRSSIRMYQNVWYEDHTVVEIVRL